VVIFVNESLTKRFLNLDKGKKICLVFLLSLVFFIFYLYTSIPSVASWGNGSNYRNYSVRATVNVTSAYPEILNITCNNVTSLTLTAGSTREVSCLVQARSYNGGNTINYVNATFYHSSNQSSDPENNNSHYTNSSCVNGTASGYYVNWTCNFNLWYYANNGTWRINSTINDSNGVTAFRSFNVTVAALLAVNVTNVIDFGQLAITQTSAAVPANVTNFGNVPVNVSVYGFGGNDSVIGANLAMLCEARNISLSNERYSLDSGAAYEAMTLLTSSSTMIQGIKLDKQTDPGALIINTTYWMIHVNETNNPFGVCNGTIVFSAENP
jgi:hypothetical protein